MKALELFLGALGAVLGLAMRGWDMLTGRRTDWHDEMPHR